MIRSCFQKNFFWTFFSTILFFTWRFFHPFIKNIGKSEKNSEKNRFFEKKSRKKNLEKSVFFGKFTLFPMFFIKGWKNLQVKNNMVEKKVQKKILLETTSNHLLFNAPGHIKNGSRSLEESSADRPRSQGGGGSPSSSRKKGSDLQIRTHVCTQSISNKSDYLTPGK